MDNTITAKELIDLIVSTKPTAEVENDEDLYPTPQGEIDVGDDGRCSLVVHPDLGSSLDMGNFCFEVGGVVVTVGRDVDGPDDDYEFDGKQIEYGDGLTEENVIAAIKANVNFPEYDATQYSDYSFDPGDVENSISVDDGDVYTEDEEGNIYCYSDESDVPEGQEVIDVGEAVHKLVEVWSENGGEADGAVMESFGPWSGPKGW